MFRVSQSKVKTWRLCRYKYHNKYTLKLLPRQMKRPFTFGRIVHSMLEAHAEGDNPFEVLSNISFDDQKYFTAQKEMFFEILEDIAQIMRDYFRYWSDDPIRPIRVKGKSAEHVIEIEIADGILFKGIVDQLGKSKVNRTRWLVEHKTFGRKVGRDHLWRNIQSASYILVVTKLGMVASLDGTCWNFISSKPSARPQLLKSGQLSRKQGIRVLPTVLDDFLKENKLSRADNKDLIAHSQEMARESFYRVFTPLNSGIIERVFGELVDSSRKMAEEKVDRTKSIGTHCDWCEYEPICRAELEGADVDFVIERGYYEEQSEEKDLDEDSASD